MSTIYLQIGTAGVAVREMRAGIPVEAVTWGKQMPALGMGSGRANPGPAKEATLLVDNEEINVAALFKLASDGKEVKEMKLNFLKGEGGTTGFQMVLSSVAVSGVSLYGPNIQFTLNFRDSDRRFLMML